MPLSSFGASFTDLIATYGYWLIIVVIGLESMGLPLPGEATLLAASIYAGHTQRLSVMLVISAAITGAILGDNLGYWIGREAGLRLLARHGRRFGLTEQRLKLGRYLFLKHGGKIVFFGRFVTLLRATAGLLAGANRMDWRRFLAFNASSAVVWAGGYGYAAYLFGGQIRHLLGPIGLVASILALVVVVSAIVAVRRHEARLIADAEAAFPGPIEAMVGPAR